MDSSQKSPQVSEPEASGCGPTTSSKLNPAARDFMPVERNTLSFRQDRMRPAYPYNHNLYPQPMFAFNAPPYVTYVPNIPIQYLPTIYRSPFLVPPQYALTPFPVPQTTVQHYTPPNPVPQTTVQHYMPPNPVIQTQIAKPRENPPAPRPIRSRPGLGWPKGHPQIPDMNYNGLHPFRIPDSVFLNEKQNPFLRLQDPFESGSFDASRTPWWTHWTIIVAHEATSIPQSDICQLYKWRYRNVIPNIKRLTLTEEFELYLYLDEKQHTDRYAYEWEERDEPQLRGLCYEYREEAYIDEGKKAAKKKNRRSK